MCPDALIEATGQFRLITRGDQVPAFAFATAPEVTAFDVYDVSRVLRERGWQVPAYTFPADRTDLAVLRIVVRNGFTMDLANLFLADLNRMLPYLKDRPAGDWPRPQTTAFHH